MREGGKEGGGFGAEAENTFQCTSCLPWACLCSCYLDLLPYLPPMLLLLGRCCYFLLPYPISLLSRGLSNIDSIPPTSHLVGLLYLPSQLPASPGTSQMAHAGISMGPQHFHRFAPVLHPRRFISTALYRVLLKGREGGAFAAISLAFSTTVGAAVHSHVHVTNLIMHFT